MYYIAAILLLFSFDGYSQEFSGSIITDPSTSRRCRALSADRQDKISMRQRLQSIILRNRNAYKKADQKRITVKRILERNYIRAQNELSLMKDQITELEEKIVRRGCPGVRL